MLGLKFSDISTTNNRPNNGWTIADPGPTAPSGPGMDDVDIATNRNMDVLWDYGSQADFAEFTYGFDGYPQPQPIAGAQFFSVEGTLVPEPASLALIALGALAPLWRRVRK